MYKEGDQFFFPFAAPLGDAASGSAAGKSEQAFTWFKGLVKSCCFSFLSPPFIWPFSLESCICRVEDLRR